MGAHHYQLEIVPRAFFEGEPPLAVTKHQLTEGIVAWQSNSSPSSQFLEGLRKLLPVERSWGEVEEYISQGVWPSDLRIWRNGPTIESIAFRYSPAGDEWSVMQRFLALVRRADCLLIEGRSGDVLPPEEKIVRASLSSSIAGQFAVDPEGAVLRASMESTAPRRKLGSRDT
jgi:hypothetical protein